VVSLVRTGRSPRRAQPAARLAPADCPGLSIMFTGALAIELGSDLTNSRTDGMALLQLATEEFFETVGVTSIVWAVYELVLFHGFALRLPP
jgi:hypothetical protein